MRNQIYEGVIAKAEQYLGDIMAELAEAQYEDEGGAGGMVEGAFELSDDDIQYCMGDALLQVIGFGQDIDLEPIVKYWFKRDYWR